MKTPKNFRDVQLNEEAMQKASRMVMGQLKQYFKSDKTIDGNTLKWSKSLAKTICEAVIMELTTHHQHTAQGIERLELWVKIKEKVREI